MVGLHFNTFESHHAEMSLALAKAPGVEVHEEAEFTWTFARSSWPHCDAFLPRLPDYGAGASIRELTDLHDDARKLSRWWVGPSARPEGLPAVLHQRGYRCYGRRAVVIADVRDCSVEASGDFDVQTQWRYPDLDRIDPTTRTRRDFRTGMEAIQSEDREGFWFVAARQEGEIIGHSMLFVSGGVLGIHTMHVPDRTQRGGVRPALLAGAADLARELGVVTLIAYAQVSAIPALIGAGFREAGEMAEYRRRPFGKKLQRK